MLGRLPRPHDGRAGVLVHAVSLAQLDLLEAGRGQPDAELALGKGARDSARPLLHVASRGLVHLGVGDDVGDRKAPAGAQDPFRLTKH
jgi:hypothetical protein